VGKNGYQRFSSAFSISSARSVYSWQSVLPRSSPILHNWALAIAILPLLVADPAFPALDQFFRIEAGGEGRAGCRNNQTKRSDARIKDGGSRSNTAFIAAILSLI
jgi:hypothetical protein